MPAPRVAVVATLELVLGALIAWGLHGQALNATQIGGGLLVVAAVIFVQTHRPDVGEEGPPRGSDAAALSLRPAGVGGEN